MTEKLPPLRTLARLALACCCCAAVAAASASPREWRFEARLDGQPIGEHRFVVATQPDGQREVRSEAAFAVRLLGIVVYRYRHTAREQWRGDCLAALQAQTTEGGGPPQVVQAQPLGDAPGAGLRVATPAADSPARDEPGCVMGFAYWHPALRQQSRLLNVQTGGMEAVRIERADGGVLPVRGVPTAAERWRIHARAQTIDVWYAALGGDWIGLDAQLAGGRKLSYRLPADNLAESANVSPPRRTP